MALDRQSIEKKDFPVGQRGYDPEAVDAHLSALADEIADSSARRGAAATTLASSASEQVRAIVEAAETSAAEIQREAEDEAREIRSEADGEAQATREQAAEQAREYVGEATRRELERLDAMRAARGARSLDRGPAPSAAPDALEVDFSARRASAPSASRGRARAAAGEPEAEPAPERAEFEPEAGRSSRGRRPRVAAIEAEHAAGEPEIAGDGEPCRATAHAWRGADGRRRRRGRPADRAQHGAERHAARADRSATCPRTSSSRTPTACSTRSTPASRARRSRPFRARRSAPLDGASRCRVPRRRRRVALRCCIEAGARTASRSAAGPYSAQPLRSSAEHAR